jgi:hypothetical protein
MMIFLGLMSASYCVWGTVTIKLCLVHDAQIACLRVSAHSALRKHKDSGQMAEPVQVYLHAGAHRTGTSSFQMCLDENRAKLTAAGYDLAYPGRDGIPGGKLKMKLPSPRHGLRKAKGFADPARAEIDKHRAGRAGLILSEENIPGRMLHFTQGKFYPAKEIRARVLAQALPGPVAHLLFVVRPYDELFVSAYRKRAEDTAVEPFEEVIPGLMQVDEGWPELMAAFRDHLAPERLTVLSYSARGSSRGMLARLVPGLDADDLDEPGQQLNLSPTDSALQDLQGRFRSGEAPSKKEVRDLMSRHATRRDRLGLAEFPAAQRAELDARYASDMDRLRGMEGVTLVESTEA